MNANKNYYKKKLYLILFILSIVLAVHGLFRYYQPLIERPWQLLSAVLYGMIKMFLFVAPLPADGDTAISYEIAKWLAPILTSALVLTKITNLLFHFKNSLLNCWSKNHLILFERTELTDALIQNLQRSDSAYRLTLICKTPIPEEWKTLYEKNSVAVHLFDIEHASPKEIREMFYKVRFDSTKAMVFGAQKDLENYSAFIHLIKQMKPEREINCYIRCGSQEIPTYLEDILANEKVKNPSLSRLDLVPFDQNDLMIRLLFSEMGASNGLLRSNFDQLRDHVQKGAESAVEALAQALGQVHFLLVGANELMEPLLHHAANDATLSLDQKIRITIVDPEAEQKVQQYLASNESIQEALDIHPIDIDPRHRGFGRILAELGAIPPTAVFLMMEDTICNLEILSKIERFFPKTPTALRNLSGVDLRPMLPEDISSVRIFGDIKEVMSEQILLRESLDRVAKDFNESYNRSSKAAGLGEGRAWSELSQTKKASSRASASHSRVKEEILRIIFADQGEEALYGWLENCRQKFMKLQESRVQNEAAFKKGFAVLLEEEPLLDLLSRMEHQRWCHSYYAMNFSYGEEKDEIARTHPCLIEDWEKIMGEKFFSCHPEYDLLSVFALFPQRRSE
ncbi:MAG: hypothetical protein Q4D77_04500 [Peptostreptococcaceae bacterium]|nr:hypothetical protein [Peptostreptococcaceae bacterium]